MRTNLFCKDKKGRMPAVHLPAQPFLLGKLSFYGTLFMWHSKKIEFLQLAACNMLLT